MTIETLQKATDIVNAINELQEKTNEIRYKLMDAQIIAMYHDDISECREKIEAKMEAEINRLRELLESL